MKKGNQIVTPLNEAQRVLVKEHIAFAMNIGRKFAGLGRYKGIAVEDLQQEACYGLCVAAQHYNQSGSFATYAYNWCYKYIMLAINDGDANALCTEGKASKAGADVEGEGDVNGDYDKDYDGDYYEKVDALLATLNRKEREVVCLLYGIKYKQGVSEDGPKTFGEIAAALHLKVMRVKQLYQGALTKLKKGNHNIF